MATQETPIHQLPQTPQGGGGNAPSADPMIQNILNNYNQQQTPEQIEASLPTTAEDIYDNEQAKYQDRQFGLQPPPPPDMKCSCSPSFKMRSRLDGMCSFSPPWRMTKPTALAPGLPPNTPQGLVK